MKTFLAILLLSLAASATTTISGTLKDLATNAAPSGSFVRFTLRGCAGNQPTVPGVGALVPTNGQSWYKDFPVDANGNVSGTIYSTRDATGNGNGDINCGGSYTSVWYGMTLYSKGKAGPEIPVHAKNGATLDPSNVTPISTTPVITAPTGDGTYVRLDAGNSPGTGNLFWNAQFTALSGVISKTVGYTLLSGDSGALFNNTSASGEVDFTLPACSLSVNSRPAGTYYAFEIDAAQTLKIVATSGAKIRYSNLLSAANGNVNASAVGNFIEVQCIGTSGSDGVPEWVVKRILGTWSLN